MQKRQVVLVDEADNELGTADIVEAHRGKGLKHRALSVILSRRVDGMTEILLQQRAEVKPVFKLLWSNTCCTNLQPGDEYLPRAVSRLREEMGIELKQENLREVYKFSYFVEDENGWCENELDTVIVGEWMGEVKPNAEEAVDYKWMEWGELRRDIERNGEIYAPWYKMILADERFVRTLK